jgi:hypothetical protein
MYLIALKAGKRENRPIGKNANKKWLVTVSNGSLIQDAKETLKFASYQYQMNAKRSLRNAKELNEMPK